MAFSLSENERTNYIYIDNDGNVHIEVPLVGKGGELSLAVGLDNTCRAGFEIKEFFAGNNDISKIVGQYIANLQQDIGFLTKFNILPDQVAKKNP